MAATAREVLNQTKETLETARLAYGDIVGTDYSRKMPGIRNFVVFGRSVTYALQNMRSVVGKEAFDEWYLPRQAAMAADPVCKHMNSMRNEVLKEGKLAVSNYASINISTADIEKFPKPPGATAFFIGDRFGGSGWKVRMADGSESTYYIDLPSEIGKAHMVFSDLSKLQPDGEAPRAVEEVAEHYLKLLEDLVAAAEDQFAPEPKAGARRPHLRLVK